jgi:acyl-coenzyme A synthetase/AMP-(fatty) acid ligase
VNSTFYSFVFTYLGAPVYVHREFNFDPEETLQIIHNERITFTSMIPTHYNLILCLPEEVKAQYDVTSIQSLLTSSAPATRAMKLEVMELFTNAKLFEAYGSTEAGLVTILRPEDQMEKLGSIGKECIGLDCIKILDEEGKPVAPGEIGELFSRGPMMFDGYHGLPDKTRNSFQGEFFSAGDMAKRDEDGFYYLVDRKANMIITGGEHVYPSEVEKVISTHPAVMECAVVGLNDYKWGEAVTAFAVLKNGFDPTDELADEVRDFCDGKLARFKKPKHLLFLPQEEIPRTGSGKILHRVLRDRFNTDEKCK